MALERAICSRCGGSGEYSFNMLDGTRCYGCSGKGKKLTKRGKIAMDSFVRSMETAIEDLQLGDQVKLQNNAYNPFVTVEAIELRFVDENERERWMVSGTSKSGEKRETIGYWELDGPKGMKKQEPRFRSWLTGEQKKALLLEAEAFQATLTKAGKPRKR